MQLPVRYRVLDFSKFTGIDEMTTMEHISRYLIQLEEASVEEAHKVRFFPLSLSGLAFN
jgi:ATP-dependent Clp protease adapter protein ClpS